MSEEIGSLPTGGKFLADQIGSSVMVGFAALKVLMQKGLITKEELKAALAKPEQLDQRGKHMRSEALQMIENLKV